MYPRAGGHCFSHHIPREVVKLDDDTYFNEENARIALDFLRKGNNDLVKGDLIIFDSIESYRNEGVAIFDGEKIIDISHEPDLYGTLPQQFHVIEDEVPIKYWE